MSVAINSTRKTVEISWNPDGAPVEPPVEEKPPGYPSHPIFYPDAKPDQGLPGEQPEIDNELPGPQPHPEHPIFLPPYIDNSLPQPQPHPDHELPGDQPYPDNTLPEFPPDVVEGVPPEVIEKIRAFLEGNLPPFSGGPDYAAPVSAGSEGAVQVFAQGQDGDWSNTAVMPNDGLAALAYPQDFQGNSYIEVRALDGTLVDSGTITVS
jgi:hypothetical protein